MYPLQLPSNCTVNYDGIWANTIAPFWNTTIRRVLNITTPQPAPGVLPLWAQNLDFANVTFNRMGWIQAYLLAKVLEPLVPTAAALDTEVTR